MHDFLGSGRHKRVVLARSLTVLLARRLTTASFPEIARAMGRPNHSTIVTAHQRISGQLDADAAAPADLGPLFGPDLTGLTLRTLADRLSAHVARTAG
jgi:chromosomal replication initiator protein